MARKSTPLEKAARMLDLVPFITSHQGISTSLLAAEFGITEEELLSDLNSLWMCGDSRFDLIDLSFDSGYVTIRNAQTLNLIRSLAAQEVISIVLGLDLLQKSIPADRQDLIDEISKLQNIMGDGISRILDANPANDSKVLSTISQALMGNQKVHITYFSPSEDEITERDVTPLDLIHRAGNDFLLAFCDRSQGERSFRVDRIQSAKILDALGVQPIPLQESMPTAETSIKIWHSERRCRESLGDSASSDGTYLHVSSYSEEWLSRTVLSAAGAMEVVSPPESRRLIAERAAVALEQYR